MGMWAAHGPLGVLDVHRAWRPWRQTAGGGRHGQGLAPGQRPCETWSTTGPAATASCAASLSKPEGCLWSLPGSPGPLVGRWLPCPGCLAGLGTRERGSGCLWTLVGLPWVLGPLEMAAVLSCRGSGVSSWCWASGDVFTCAFTAGCSLVLGAGVERRMKGVSVRNVCFTGVKRLGKNICFHRGSVSVCIVGSFIRPPAWGPSRLQHVPSFCLCAFVFRSFLFFLGDSDKIF